MAKSVQGLLLGPLCIPLILRLGIVPEHALCSFGSLIVFAENGIDTMEHRKIVMPNAAR